VDAGAARLADSVARNDAGASVGELSAAKSLSAQVPPGRDAAAPSATDAVSSMEVAQNEMAKKESDAKADQLSKTSSFGRMKAKQEPDAVAVSSQPATPVAPTEKDEFRASSSQMANVGAFASARQASTWQITDAGDLQRSFDGGKNWESISVNQPARLRVVVAIGFHIWAGGNGGLLFHSEDGGSHFAPVRIGQSPAALSGDIVTLAFADAQQGRLETSSHEVWTTSDGGKTWLSSAPAK
jgi:hypothetical protein